MKPVSPKGLEVLRAIQRGAGPYAGCDGRSEHGARHQVVGALYRRALIDEPTYNAKLTAKGLAVLDANGRGVLVDVQARIRALRALDLPVVQGLRFSTLGQRVYGDTSVATASRTVQAFCRPGARLARALERLGDVTIGSDSEGFTQVRITHHGRTVLRDLLAANP